MRTFGAVGAVALTAGASVLLLVLHHPAPHQRTIHVAVRAMMGDCRALNPVRITDEHGLTLGGAATILSAQAGYCDATIPVSNADWYFVQFGQGSIFLGPYRPDTIDRPGFVAEYDEQYSG